MKMSVLYHSKSGNTKKMAESIATGMNSVEGTNAKAFSIEEVDEDFLRESDCVVLGTPTYLATMCSEIKVWLDKSSMKYGLAGKIGGAFATADYLHGGAEIAIQSILSHFMVLGMMTYSGGGSFGKPYIHLGPIAFKDNLDEYAELFELYGQRMATKTKEIFAK